MKSQFAVHEAQLTSEGDAVEVKRLFPGPAKMNFDPFVLWDHFSINPGAGFPDHPHRGFEALTYLFKGTMQHSDNLGNQSTVHPGGVQRFTAGKGLVHSEMPGTEGISEGIQLWVNSARADKMRDPDYQQVNNNELPVTEWEQGSMTTIVGDGSPVKLLTPVIYQKLVLQQKGDYTLDIPANYQGICYVVNGEASIEGNVIPAGYALLSEKGGQFNILSEDACTVMIAFGQPHREPIHQHGPFVD